MKCMCIVTCFLIYVSVVAVKCGSDQSYVYQSLVTDDNAAAE